MQKEEIIQENESSAATLERQLAENKKNSQNTEFEKDQQITNLKADLEKVINLFTSVLKEGGDKRITCVF